MASQCILIVEDDSDIQQLLQATLVAAGFSFLEALDGTEAIPLAREKKPDLILLDLMLPGMGGADVCRELKHNAATRHIPVIMLTALGEEIDRVVGFELGVDDYVVKPFSPRELVLRIRAVLKRVQAGADSVDDAIQAQSPVLQVDQLMLDQESHTACIAGTPIDLTVTEFRLLHELMLNKGKVRTRENLLAAVWGYSFDGYARTVDTHIRRLRQKLESQADAIETVRGVGYRLKS